MNLCHNKYQRASSCIVETMILLSLKTIIPPALNTIFNAYQFSLHSFHTYPLILSSFLTLLPSLLPLIFNSIFPIAMDTCLVLSSYKHVLLGHLLATSQELTFLSLFPCLKLMPSAHANYSFFPIFHQNKSLRFTMISIS